MITLTEALIQRFPHGNEWARQALGALGGEVEPHTLVHALTKGWTRRVAGGSVELVDTLFVLTEDRIAMGQALAGTAGSHWIPTRSIKGLDAIDDSPHPLETIEMRLLDGTELWVGWTEDFTTALLDVLTRQLDDSDGDDDSMPAELSDPSSVQADASALDALAPSPWVEQTVIDRSPEEPDGPAAPFGVDAGRGDAPESPGTNPPGPPTSFSVQSTEDRVDLHLHPAWTSSDHPAPPSPPPMFGSRLTAPAPAPPTARSTSYPEAAPHIEATADLEVDAQPETEAFDDGFVAPSFAPTGSGPVPNAFAPPPPPSTEAPSDPMATPWQSPSVAWPEALKNVTYLGGHPGHQRKRKNGTLAFAPEGIDIRGGGFSSWSMHVDWSFVERIEVFGADEVMFTDHMKIDGNSSAVVIQVLDGTKLYFEVRLRRPPSLRVTLAPILTLVEDIRVERSSSF